ncbi:unnamed protein product [Durusdinium trenchii]|uniref:Uncharacterized protein n=1 Tax=Durusdinium trenchii TaxID=1381693 RepID=A0ABP0KJ74_9DINO
MVREDECELHGVVETGAFEADDPRRSRKGEFKRLDGLNTRLEDRDPASTFVNPAMRVHVGLPGGYKGTLTSDDVLIVPELLCGQEDLSLYHNMVEEIRHAQAEGMKDARWASWKDGCHLINKAPDCSATYRDAVAKIIAYFRISAPSMYSRFNWYAACQEMRQVVLIGSHSTMTLQPSANAAWGSRTSLLGFLLEANESWPSAMSPMAP